MLLSILVPVYNVAPYLAEFLASCEAGLDERIEVVFCDDASTDSSLEIIRTWQQIQTERGFFGIRIIQNEVNQGITPTRECLLHQAQGEYLWFIDPDDILVDGAISTIIYKLTLLHPDVVLFDYQVFDDKTRCVKAQERLIFRDNDEKIINQNHALYRLAIKDNKHYFWNKVFRRELVQSVEVHATPVYEDVCYVPTWLSYCRNYMYLNQPLLKYRLRAGSLSHRKDFTQIYAIEAYLYQANFCAKHVRSNKTYAHLLYKAYVHSFRLQRSFRKNNCVSAESRTQNALDIAQLPEFPLSSTMLIGLLLINGMVDKALKVMFLLFIQFRSTVLR